MPINPIAITITRCRSCLCCILGASLLLHGLTPPVTGEPPNAASLAKANSLLKSGDQLAKEARFDEAVLAYQRAYQLILPAIRKRSFQRDVTPRIMTRKALQEYLAKEFAKEMTEQESLFMDRTAKLFGFAPDDLDVKSMLLALFTEEVVGFYNSETKEMFLIAERTAKEPKGRDRLDRLLVESAFDPDEQKSTLAHEMAHALADQHFNLHAYDKLFDNNEDAALAASALIEGEAVLVMLAEMTRNRGGDGAQVLDLSPKSIDQVFRAMDVSGENSGKAMRAAPRFFQESLIFPYHRGTMFAAHLANQSGWKAIDHALCFPPTSTEQILHPEKYSKEQRDEPTRLIVPPMHSLSAWNRLGEDTLGEYQIRLLLSGEEDAEQAAAGWGGDRYFVYQRPNAPQANATNSAAAADSALLWITTWDEASDAVEFLDAYGRASVRRLKRGQTTPSLESANFDAPDGKQYSLRYVTGGVRTMWASHRGKDVAVVEGLEGELAKSVIQQLHRSRHSLWDYRLPPLERP